MQASIVRKIGNKLHLALLLAAVLELFTAKLPAAERVALVIGNNAYKYGTPLNNCINDARAVTKALKDVGFQVIVAEDAGLEQMEAKVLEFRRASQGAKAAWFFYSGHGVEVKGANYLVPVDAEVKEEFQIKHKAFALDQVMAAMDEAGTPLKVVVLDCCRDNPFGKGWSRSGARGLGQVGETPKGTIIAFATAPGKVAADGSGKNSPFTTALVASIAKRGLEIQQVFNETGRTVLASTANEQQPWINSSFFDSFILVPGTSARAMPLPGDPQEAAASSYTPWMQETLEIAASIPVQDGGRIKPLVTYAAELMLKVHGTRSMEIEQKNGMKNTLKPMAWLLDALFRPEISVQQPTFLIGNPAALVAISLKPNDKSDLYSYDDLKSARDNLIELAESYEATDAKQRGTVQKQIIDLAHNLRNYETLLGYFSFARSGVTLYGSGKDGAPDQRADISAIMTSAPQIQQQVSEGQGKPLEPQLQSLLTQTLDAANFSKFGLFLLPSADAENLTWQSAGNAIMEVMSVKNKEPELAIADIKMLESIARSINKDEVTFRKELTILRGVLAKRAEARGEYKSIDSEARIELNR